MGRTGERGAQEAGQLAAGGVGATERGRVVGVWESIQGEGILGGKYEVEVGSQNALFTGMRKEAWLARDPGGDRVMEGVPINGGEGGTIG